MKTLFTGTVLPANYQGEPSCVIEVASNGDTQYHWCWSSVDVFADDKDHTNYYDIYAIWRVKAKPINSHD